MPISSRRLNRNWNWFWPIILIITMLAAILRFAYLDTIPIALNRDEVSIGYNAFSLLTTGKEEHGVAWPINVESFGDWKLPVYIYLSIPSIAMFGLNEWSIRLPAALAGTLLVPATAWLGLQIWHNHKSRRIQSVAAAIIIAFSPWTIRLSRQTYESMVGLLFITLAAGLIWHGRLHPKRQKWAWPFAAFFCVLAMFTYHAYQGFVPVFIFGFGIILWSTIRRSITDRPAAFLSSAAIGIIGIIFLLITGSSSANQTKLSGLSIFEKSQYAQQLFEKRQQFTNPESLQARIFANTPLLISQKAANNLLSVFSIDFLFINGGHHGSHDVAGMGNISIIAFLLACVGVWEATKRRSRALWLFIWIVAAFVAPMITLEAAHSVRILPFMVALALFAGWGFGAIQHTLKHPFQYIITAFLIAIFAYETANSLYIYFRVSPIRDANNWHWVMKQAVPVLSEYAETAPVHVPYLRYSYAIYFPFYTQMPANTFREKVEYAPKDQEGFRYISKLGNLDFTELNWDKFMQSEQQEFAFVKESDLKTNYKNYRIISQYYYPQDDVNFLLVSNF